MPPSVNWKCTSPATPAIQLETIHDAMPATEKTAARARRGIRERASHSRSVQTAPAQKTYPSAPMRAP